MTRSYGYGADLMFGNENDVTELPGTAPTPSSAARGNDSVLRGAGRETIQGNEGNDTIRGDAVGGISIDTIAGGTGNDVFAYSDSGGDGNNAGGGGPVEQITDLDWSVDHFQTGVAVTLRRQHRGRHRGRPQRVGAKCPRGGVRARRRRRHR